MTTLTSKEIKILNAMRTNEYEDAIDSSTWVFTAIDNSGLEPKVARGVIASLIKKNLVGVNYEKACADESVIYFTKEGKELFKQATGKEIDNVEYPRLLAE